MGFRPICACVNTIVRKHHTDAGKTRREKARRKLKKTDTSYTEQILEVTPNGTKAAR